MQIKISGTKNTLASLAEELKYLKKNMEAEKREVALMEANVIAAEIKELTKPLADALEEFLVKLAELQAQNTSSGTLCVR